MSQWLDSTLLQAEVVKDDLLPKRQRSLELLRQAKKPGRKNEAWKYTSINGLDAIGSASEAANNSLKIDSEYLATIPNLESIDLVFVDGKFDISLSTSDLPAGLIVNSLNNIDSESKQWVTENFSNIKPEKHFFGLLNDVLAKEGALIRVRDGVVIEKVIRIIHILSKGVKAHTRILVQVGEAAGLKVIEQFLGSELSFNTGFAEYELCKNGQLEHYRLALQTGDALSIGGSHFKLHERSQLNSTLVGFGSNLSRVDVDVRHCGEFANAEINAIYLLDGKELFDLHSTIEHEVANCTTEENVRGIVADRARAVFNGRIHIHRYAQKTLAELNNRNLLLSSKAEVDTKPELEIYADDVKCAHGATIAEIDQKALYYLLSRGIDKNKALEMLNFGFINELLDNIPSQHVADWLRPQLRKRFSAMTPEHAG
ncbi:Fe-S cluster assembly protein SufD [Aurantivibrio infirmus]